MNSKERVIRAINHREVDRVPFFYLGTTVINRKLSEKLGFSENAKKSVFAINDYEQLLQYLNIDVRFISPRLCQIPNEQRQGFQGGGVHAKLYKEKGHEKLVITKLPLEDATTVDEILNYDKWPDPDWYDYRIPENLLESYHDKAIVAYDMGIIFLYAMGMRGIENIMIDMALNPDIAHAIFKKIAQFNLERTRRFLEANQGLIDIVGIGDDVAGQDGILFSIEMWRHFLRPYIADMVQLCNEYGVIPYFHGCGGFRGLFPDFIYMRIQCVGRLQTEARGNNFVEIKQEFGDKLCLWGGIDGQHIMIEGSTEQVQEHVSNLLRVGSVGSGYIAGPTHSFTEDTPLENILLVCRMLNAGSV